MNRDDWERIVCSTSQGLYESNYLKANSMDGRWGLWIKHNLLRTESGYRIAEFWIVLSRPDGPPIIGKKEVEWSELTLSETAIYIGSNTVTLTPTSATGTIADVEWNLRLSDGGPALFHFPWDWMYRGSFPKKKAITPDPHLRFNGEIKIAGKTITVSDWHGIRGHNWGTEHAWTYAYGNCQLWTDGRHRTVDGFSAKIKLPTGIKSPWLSTVVANNPDLRCNTPSHWFGKVSLTPTSWSLTGRAYELKMSARPDQMVGLRYIHPSGTESYCYNTKFASVSWKTGTEVFTSDRGEFESLFPAPVPEIRLHPPTDWNQSQGDYRA